MAQEQIENKKLIIIGGSSGALDALLLMLPTFTLPFNLPIIIILHRSNHADNGLVDLLASKTALQVKEADEKDLLKPGWIYVSPPDYHLLTEDDGTLSLDASEKVNYCRPSIDVTFVAAAEVYKHNLAAMLLSGANADGAAGLREIKKMGGYCLVQNPAEAMVDYMPRQALQLMEPDRIIDAAGAGRLLNALAKN